MEELKRIGENKILHRVNEEREYTDQDIYNIWAKLRQQEEILIATIKKSEDQILVANEQLASLRKSEKIWKPLAQECLEILHEKDKKDSDEVIDVDEVIKDE